MGAYHSTKNFEIFETGTKGTEVPENTEIVEFPKSEPFNRKFRRFGTKVKWNGNFQEKFLEKLGIPHEVVLFFGIYTNS